MTPADAWHRTETGQGRPLVLLHGIGSSHEAWAPVIGRLAASRRVIAFDLPGHGATAVPPRGTSLEVPGLADQLAVQLEALGIVEPVDLVGNSLGGWISLEAARRGRARSVVALCPAGLWTDRCPASTVRIFHLTRSLGRRWPGLAPRLLRSPLGRTALMWPFVGRPWRTPAAVAVEASGTLVRTPVFDDLLAALLPTRFTGGAAIEVPVTVAFGSRDRILPRRSARSTLELPTVKWVTLRGCGHVPMWDDPDLVVETILAGTA